MEAIRGERGVIAGGVSVLMIFLTMSVAIYGLLSLLTAENELALNQKNRDATTAYYSADAIAAKMISELASARVRGESIGTEDDVIPVSYDFSAGIASFIVPIDTYRNLDVSISFPESRELFVIERYSVVNSLDWQEQIVRNITVITVFD